MIEESRIDIYTYLRDLFFETVTENVYIMDEPKELTESDVEEGFLVISIGDFHDESEFRGHAYGQVRAYIAAYIPPMSRGRLDEAKYKTFETAVTEVVNNEMEHGSNERYTIVSDTFLSLDGLETTNANNSYHVFVKSFIISVE